MDTEHMIAYLIDGGLIKILDAGTFNASKAFIARDDASPSGFRVVFHMIEDENTSPLGAQVTPKAATNGMNILEEKREQVEIYLVESFGLNGAQAKRVVHDAHWILPLAA